mmetsp:Transcript_39402/g.66161  ORF Transcript_39402/g.66161 Transcript_39402/m.66161 type:complete len:257 (+) Transcript_39402:2067-2837(+)
MISGNRSVIGRETFCLVRFCTSSNTSIAGEPSSPQGVTTRLPFSLRLKYGSPHPSTRYRAFESSTVHASVFSSSAICIPIGISIRISWWCCPCSGPCSGVEPRGGDTFISWSSPSPAFREVTLEFWRWRLFLRLLVTTGIMGTFKGPALMRLCARAAFCFSVSLVVLTTHRSIGLRFDRRNRLASSPVISTGSKFMTKLSPSFMSPLSSGNDIVFSPIDTFCSSTAISEAGIPIPFRSYFKSSSTSTSSTATTSTT